MSPEILHILQFALSAIFLVGGVFFVVAGTVGVLRLPDFYTRMHAAGMTDTLGAELILLGLIVQAGWSQMSLKLALIAFLLFLTSPTASHAVVGAAHHAKLKPKLGKYRAPAPGEVPKPKVKTKAKAKAKAKAKPKTKKRAK
ncbi:MAG: monovalent cation/H(+) antiporter subunit G [Robiginitomaculum sp.]|nr:monovalent cation/H(+) antiporter subunit G [Robiginitomaculum sp.]